MNFKIVIIAISLIIVVGCDSETPKSGVSAEESAGNSVRKQTEPPTKAKISEIVQSFTADKLGFEKNFKGKVVAIDGKIESVEKKADGVLTILLKDLEKEAKIRVQLRNTDEENVKLAGKETQVRVLGDIEQNDAEVSVKSRIFSVLKSRNTESGQNTNAATKNADNKKAR